MHANVNLEAIFLIKLQVNGNRKKKKGVGLTKYIEKYKCRGIYFVVI